jgi:hypothetical protein
MYRECIAPIVCLFDYRVSQVKHGAFEKPNVRPILHVHDATQPLFPYQAYQSA